MTPKIDVKKAIDTSTKLLLAFGPTYGNLARHHMTLMEALEKYGWHRYLSCPKSGLNKKEGPCNCGWDDVARDLLPTTPRAEEE